jgi:anaerobic selenocysteine-containing dehydrogenase
VGDRRSTWWVLVELGRRLGHDLADTGGTTDDDLLAKVASRARCSFDELAGQGWAETGHELPAPWVDAHVERLGGWRLAPQLLVDQLAALGEPAPLVLVPRRQVRRLNSQFGYLDEPAEIVVHPDDAAAAGVADGEPVAVRTGRGELVGVAKVDESVRRGAVSVPHAHEGANVNRLTDKDDLDLLTGMAHYSGFPVTLHPA